MHPSTLHAGPVVESLSVPPGAPSGDIPLPNHSHIIDGDNFNPIWWQTIAVRVIDESIWPDFDGGCPANPADGPPCLTSFASLRAAQQPEGQSRRPTNVFPFFDSVLVDLL